MIKEIGTIIVQVAKNGGANAVQIFAMIYIVDIIKLLIMWLFIFAICKGLYSLMMTALGKVKNNDENN